MADENIQDSDVEAEMAAAADSQDAADEAAGGDESANRIENLETELADTKDRLLRSIADAENVRRRAEREKSDASAYAVTKFARDMLAVADNMRRAMESMPEGATADDSPLKGLAAGIEMTERELLTVFERHGITKVDPVGEKFDHNFHQAMSEVETEDAASGSVIQVYQSGYVIKDRLLRPAMVVIAKAPKGAAKSPEKPAGEGVDETV